MNFRRSVKEIREMYRSHMNESEVARELGVSRQSLNEYRIRHGIPYDPIRARKRRNDTLYGERNHRIIEAHLAGKDIEELCDMFGMNAPALNYILIKHKAKKPSVRKTVSRNADLMRLREQGATITELATQFGLNKFYVRNLIHQQKKKKANG